MKDILENRQMLGQMGRRAYREAKEKYLSDRNTEEIEQFYNTVMKKKQ